MISQRALFVSPIANDVLEGLTRTPKSLSPKLFYDQQGSELFDQITELPEYYLTRVEQEILHECSGDIVRQVRGLKATNLTLLELGAGTSAKTASVIAAIFKVQKSLTYYPLDVSPAALETGAARLRSAFPSLDVEPLVADYTQNFPPIEAANNTRKLVLYIGSSVGNFDLMDACSVLATVRHRLSPGDALLLGTDLAKAEDILVPAYNDAAGVTARFNKNLLARINRELGGQFDLDTFRHVALWNSRESRIEMHLESVRDQVVSVRDLKLRVRFQSGERIHTENSYKFTHEMISSVLHNAGFQLERSWTDSRQWFALHLARVA